MLASRYSDGLCLVSNKMLRIHARVASSTMKRYRFLFLVPLTTAQLGIGPVNASLSFEPGSFVPTRTITSARLDVIMGGGKLSLNSPCDGQE